MEKLLGAVGTLVLGDDAFGKRSFGGGGEGGALQILLLFDWWNVVIVRLGVLMDWTILKYLK